MAILVNPPCVLFEDDHLLVVNKPPGWNTHSPAPYAGEGIYEWLKNREPRWARLAIIHRLDKETSGVMVFSKTAQANRSLTQQFTQGKVRKEYILRSLSAPPKKRLTVTSHLKRVGDRYASEPGGASGVDAATEFELVEKEENGFTIVARPRTGRTHQIRIHAAENGFPILGDTLYGGSPHERLCLHARALEFAHPSSGEPIRFAVDPLFNRPAWSLLRPGFIAKTETDAHRWIHGGSDGFPNWYVDQFGPYLLSQSPYALWPESRANLERWFPGSGVYHKITTATVRGKSLEETSPKHVAGPAAEGPFTIRENGVQYEVNFAEGYSPGIFLDQRDNRRRLLTNYVSSGFFVREGGLAGAEVLNTFAYTCAFSVCAALAGARVTSLDLSRKYLDWGRQNFRLNNVEASQHDFIFGDVFDWLKRFTKKRRLFDVVLLDPPTFSKSKRSGFFRAEHDYARLIAETLELLRPGGVLFASSNAARWAPEDFVKKIHQTVATAQRRILREHYAPQPPDFPISKSEPAYLKTIWLRIE